MGKNNLQISIESVGPNHLCQIFEIERLCFSDPWSPQSFLGEIANPNGVFLVACLGAEVLGFVLMWHIVNEGHILNIAVKPEYRRRGVADALINGLEAAAIAKEIIALTLEVRLSNISARKLYEKHGFLDGGLRKNYYSNPTEDAIIMWKNLEVMGGSIN